MDRIKESELILNEDGSIFHLRLRPDQIADRIILVGDQGRVARISERFDRIEHQVENREFVTHTGTYRGTRISAVSTGIGTDNIDIVVNELDALVNIDLEKRVYRQKHHSLQFVRLGTSGAVQKDIPVDSFVASAFGLGFDGLLHFYSHKAGVRETELEEAFIRQTEWGKDLARPYIVKASDTLLNQVAAGFTRGLTLTANGFYGPQGRQLRLPLAFPLLNDHIESFKHDGLRITNFEMETSALYALSKLLGHQALTVCAIIANRAAGTYSKDYKPAIERLIDHVLQHFSQ